MPNVTIKMTDAKFAALEGKAHAQGTTKAGVLREALRQQETAASGSAFDLVADLVGSVEGPSDLATNPKYMKGFGEPRSLRRK